jgi:hypothetical protein
MRHTRALVRIEIERVTGALRIANVSASSPPERAKLRLISATQSKMMRSVNRKAVSGGPSRLVHRSGSV